MKAARTGFYDVCINAVSRPYPLQRNNETSHLVPDNLDAVIPAMVDRKWYVNSLVMPLAGRAANSVGVSPWRLVWALML